MENDRGNSHSGSGAGERATETVNALTERAPTARNMRAILRDMMVCSVRGTDNNGTRPEVRVVGEKNWGEPHSSQGDQGAHLEPLWISGKLSV